MPESLVPFAISVCGIEELDAHCEAAVSHVLSILDPDWPVPSAFSSFRDHSKLELRFHDVIEESNVGILPPQQAHVTKLLAFGRQLLKEQSANAHLLVHCHAGVSRSTASMALMLAQALPDVPGSRVFEEVLRIRPQAWPNLRMIEIGDVILDRRGDLVAAVGKLYHAQLDRRQYAADQLRSGGRGREVELAETSRF